MHRALLLTTLLFATVLLRTATTAHAGPDVVVRTYNYAQICPGQLAVARATTELIFRAARISIAWVDCRVPELSEGAACLEPLRERRELILRLMDHGSPSAGETERIVSLGSSLVDRRQRRGVLMTLDRAPVRAVAEAAGLDEPTLLGRAIAHEIGHLLLGTTDHAPHGLMRALWSQDELRGLKRAEWQFSSRESAQMRHLLAWPVSGN